MTEYVYVGRRRHPAKVLVYQLLTVGVYGRVLLYKMLREFDGHEALFLDRRPYIFLLILPFVGPLLVKRRIAALVDDLIHHDVTAKVPSRRALVFIALIPLAPWFHWKVQSALNHHWKMHTKEEELALKQAQLAALERRSRTKENLEAAEALRKEVNLRAKELDDLKAAALALREAEQVRRAAEREMRRTGLARRRLSMGMVRKILPAAAFRRRGAATGLAEPAQEAAEEPAAPEGAAKPEVRAPRKGREPEPVPPAEASAAPAEAAKPRGLFGFLRRGPGRSKDERREEKLRAKEERRARKEQKREAKRLRKLQAAEEKARGIEERAAAKQKAKDEKVRRKEKEVAAKQKAASKGEKGANAKAKKEGKKGR